MQANLRVVMAQLNFSVADIAGNSERIIQAATHARDQYQADVIVFPELCLTGYPPEDLLLRPAMQSRIEQALHRLLAEVQAITLVIGLPWQEADERYNCAAVIQGGQLIRYHKQHLPNQQVFDEKRYFSAGQQICRFTVKGLSVALAICEDLWQAEPVQQAKAAGAQLLLTLNAEPVLFSFPITPHKTVN